MHLRVAVTSDAGAVAQLFHDAIRALSAGDYSSEQIEAWAGAPEAAPSSTRSMRTPSGSA